MHSVGSTYSFLMLNLVAHEVTARLSGFIQFHWRLHETSLYWKYAAENTVKPSRTKVPIERYINREPHPCKRACRSTLWSYKDCNKSTLLCSHKQWCDLLCPPQRIGKYWLVCQVRTHNRTYYGNCSLMCTCLSWRRKLQNFCCTLFCGSKLANRTEIRRLVLFNLPP